MLPEKLHEGKVMVAVALKCPVRPYSTSNGKKRYTCKNPACSHKTFYAEYRYNGYKPEVKKAIIKWAVDGAGIRATVEDWGKHRYGHKGIKKKRR
jgi:transposase-like protein